MTAPGAAGDFARDLMGGVLAYAAGLVGEISDDIVNIDRAMRWGFAWKRGPFELIDDIGHDTLAAILEASGEPLPRMLRVARMPGRQPSTTATASLAWTVTGTVSATEDAA